MNLCLAVAHRLELNPFLFQFSQYDTLQTAKGKLFRLKTGDLNIHIVRTGIGMDNARKSLSGMLELRGNSKTGGTPDLLLNFGTCGAIDPARRIGDLVVGTRTTRDYHMNTLQTLDIPRGKQFASYLRGMDRSYTTGTIYSTDRAVASRYVRREIYQRTNAQVVDMESCSLAEVASKENIPFLSVKYVSDNADEFVMKDFLVNIEQAAIELGKIMYGFIQFLLQTEEHASR